MPESYAALSGGGSGIQPHPDQQAVALTGLGRAIGMFGASF
jgi:hypothetical protein